MNSITKYCIANQIHSSEEGWSPDIPEDVTFLLLAEPNIDVTWALYRVELDAEEVVDESMLFVSDELEGLLISAERFPPSIALSRDKVHSIFKNVNPSKKEFLDKYETCLKEYFKSQRRNKYFFAEALADKLGYLTKGNYYWVIGYDGKDDKLLWVSDDYFVCRNPVSDFDVDDFEKTELGNNVLDF